MATNNTIHSFESHSFKSFLDKYHIVIPMVQRDYAQGRTTVEVNRIRSRFLDAIKQCLVPSGPSSKVMKLDFVYGEKENVWSDKEVNKIERIIVTPLDGQQRLTTLYLLHWYAAKKDGVSEKTMCFLNHFTYDIRPSSRDFCSHLMQFDPDLNQSLEAQLTDQNWFMGEWNQDPTILSMLVMLDAIRDSFRSVDCLWKKLTEEERIVFYFLPLSENGLSDELYIKMNSRGKKLTPFEHFKAEYESLYEKDSKESADVNHKFDVEWTDTLFPYRSSDETVDREFMRYFYYISHILCYEQAIEKTSDEFALIKDLYKDSPKAKENREFLEKAFDCWHSVLTQYKEIDLFFQKYLCGFQYEHNKVATYKRVEEYRGKQNFFNACIKLYQVNNNFSYSDFIFLYGIILFLMNKEKVKENDFIDRLRILRNLIWNSNSGEIRGDADYMRDLLSEVKTLILDGIIKKDLDHGFKDLQEDEEIEKQQRKASLKPEELNMLYSFEDHPLIYGFVSGLKYENLYLTPTFKTVFDNDSYTLIHQAMISVGDYSQDDGNRYYLGNANRSTWAQLLHKSRNRDGFDDRTMPTLISLLKRVHNGETLRQIVDKYTIEQENLGRYPWRYYFAKYPDMLRGADGELTWGSNKYNCTTLNKHQFNGKHWNPFLNVIYNKLAESLKTKFSETVLKLENYGDNLHILHPSSSLESTETGFIYYYQNHCDTWAIPQDSGTDTTDRIVYAVNKICGIVDEHYKNKDTNA